MELLKNEITSVISKIEDVTADFNPYPHFYIENCFLNTEEIFEKEPDNKIFEFGRINKFLTFHDVPVDYDKLYNHFMDLSECLFKKFKIDKKVESVRPSLEYWIDNEDFDITDIHTDYLILKDGKKMGDDYELISGQVYLPDENDDIKLGTRIHEYIGEDIEKDTVYSDELISVKNHLNLKNNNNVIEKFPVIKEIPFKRGVMFFHHTVPNSWHSAPKIPKGYIRKSMMIRLLIKIKKDMI